MMRGYLAGILIAAGVAFAATAASSAGDNQPFANPGPNEKLLLESENLQAFVRLKKSGKWCAVQTSIRLYIRNDSVFGGEKKELNTLLANLPGVLRSQCNKVRNSRVKAFLGKRPVYIANITAINSEPRISERITNRKIADKYRKAASDGLTLEKETRRVSLDGGDVELTTMEFELLHVLMESHGRVMSRNRLIERLRGIDADVYDRSIDMLVSRLRDKLGDDSQAPRFIRTVRLTGYQFVGKPGAGLQ